ncbi:MULTISPECIES: thiamine phosphate synthase [unclassified Enterococcus]|uniref:thiamine phosphate synthase n=1 Tax=unclassified Enterococcus TaxID=2608891 RepID=UPI001553B1F9|nr:MULTISPECIES: thiamine phosphate synthase [unclassified Enterococcus]MBS7576573.1 thiamine phosphate synthase [Enterococcus sp. MMGLQ5-2]MBS7583940.1 thiamine phosphate synthase [Enterococcus sp. MMGLQ5-1]NPD11801.1 thiamine phosphate synthase [Enterococcus sp. MMGLQ5-1]NPD36410.1 thiamine phosphate synthase [Enterococcus sp. MMGLQ5-2]
MPKSFDLTAYLIIGSENTLGRPLSDVVCAALEGGITFLQLREKHLATRDFIESAVAIAQIVTQFNQENKKSVKFVINDRLDVVLAAKELGAQVDGIHIGQDDISPKIARKLLGEAAIIGLTCDSLDLVLAANREFIKTIDYIGAGPIHATPTKIDCGHGYVQGVQGIASLALKSELPLVAGGGIKEADLEALAKTQVAGWFVVSAITTAEDIFLTTQSLIQLWQKYRSELV